MSNGLLQLITLHLH